MFGIMNLKNGRVLIAKSDILLYTGWKSNLNFDDGLVAVPKDYINTWESGHKCEHNGCFENGEVACHVPELHGENGRIYDDTNIRVVEHLCSNHAYEAGYCTLCGDFWGGIESFDFNNPSHLCENCKEQIEDEIGEDDDINGENYDEETYAIK